MDKNPPKGNVRFSIGLSEEQKKAKTQILKHPFNFIMRKVYNKPAILEKMENEEKIELVSLSHFRGRTFDDAVVIVDEFQNLTRAQFAMALGRLGKNSMMMLCGDNQQIDLKDKNYSAIHEVAKIMSSDYVYKVILKDNHRHEAIFDVLELLNSN